MRIKYLSLLFVTVIAMSIFSGELVFEAKIIAGYHIPGVPYVKQEDPYYVVQPV